MYKYETHMHTSPVSKCATATVRDSLIFYKQLGYDGVFVTNHFLDGNIGIDNHYFDDNADTTSSVPYEERIEFYFSDYEKGLEVGKEIGIKVFLRVESSYKGTDFLIYGLDKAWYLAHPKIMEMKKSSQLSFFREQGALVIQAHPFRQARYIDHVRLFPDRVDGFEVINASRTDTENKMALLYADEYHLLKTAGSDNHDGIEKQILAGMAFETPLESEMDYIRRIKNGEGHIFTEVNCAGTPSL